jgi:hypothetical protein
LPFRIWVVPNGDTECAGDFDRDGDTDLADLGVVLAGFNDPYTLADLGLILADFGCAR